MRRIKSFAKHIIIGSPFEGIVRRVLNKQVVVFVNSTQYWEDRYRSNGNSGSGSYGRLADFKAEVINEFVTEHSVESVIEFGCGDGNQLTLMNYKNYLGFDISPTVLEICRKRFEGDNGKAFLLSRDYENQTADLALSLDVILHLVEEEAYETYMKMLFGASKRFVIIYSTNSDTFKDSPAADSVKHRRFSDWVENNLSESWRLNNTIKNRYPFDPNDWKNTSPADFFIYERTQ